MKYTIENIKNFTDDLIKKILSAAIYQEDVINESNWVFYVVRNEELTSKLRSISERRIWQRGEYISIVICSNEKPSTSDYKNILLKDSDYIMDTIFSCVALFSLWIHGFDKKNLKAREIKKALKIPRSTTVFGIVHISDKTDYIPDSLFWPIILRMKVTEVELEKNKIYIIN